MKVNNQLTELLAEKDIIILLFPEDEYSSKNSKKILFKEFKTKRLKRKLKSSIEVLCKLASDCVKGCFDKFNFVEQVLKFEGYDNNCSLYEVYSYLCKELAQLKFLKRKIEYVRKFVNTHEYREEKPIREKIDVGSTQFKNSNLSPEAIKFKFANEYNEISRIKASIFKEIFKDAEKDILPICRKSFGEATSTISKIKKMVSDFCK